MAREAEREAYEATKRGDVTTFQDVLQKEPYLVDGASYAYSRNLLHIATMWEQEDIVEDLLRRNRRLASDLDSNNSSPLHIAVTQGNLQITSMLLRLAPDMCWARDCQGMNPIHIAAKNGHFEILEHLIELNSFAAMERVYRGQTVLHLCVKHGQLRELQFLVEKLGDLVCAKDDDDETLLHWAVRFNQLEMVRYLVESTDIDVLTRNSMGYSPFGVLTRMPPNQTTLEIRKILRKSKQYLLTGIVPDSRISDAMMVVVALIATVAFQSIVSPPGGVWQDDSPTHKAGEAVMASNRPQIYKLFIGFNTVAFVASLIAMYMMILESPFFIPVSSAIALLGFTIALTTAGFSYGASLMVILPNPVTQTLGPALIAYFAIALFLFVIISLGIFWKKRKERR